MSMAVRTREYDKALSLRRAGENINRLVLELNDYRQMALDAGLEEPEGTYDKVAEANITWIGLSGSCINRSYHATKNADKSKPTP